MIYSKTYCMEFNQEVFNKLCNEIENKLDPLIKNDLLVDVDGTQIQIFFKDDKKIVVINDLEIGAVFIDSEIDISNIII